MDTFQTAANFISWSGFSREGISVNKDVVAPNLEEMNLAPIRLVQNSMNNMKIADFVITEDLLPSCSHASMRH